MNKSPENTSPEKLNRIVEGTSIEGDINSEGNIRVDGKVNGTLTTNGRVVIGASGIVDGEVSCNDGEVEGKVNGKINVKELLSLKSTAVIEGDIYTDKLSIEPGAKFTGSCSMGVGETSKKELKTDNSSKPSPENKEKDEKNKENAVNKTS